MTRASLLSALTAAIACAAAAPSPAADDPRDVFRAQAKSVFFDQDVARGAVQDISRMREPELHAFVRYLAECEDADAGFAADRAVLHACAVARIEYQLEFNAGRPLDKWIAARSSAFEAPRPRTTICSPAPNARCPKSLSTCARSTPFRQPRLPGSER